MESKTVSAPAGARIAYIDNLRWSVIAMVVLMHACVTYSSQGSWFFMEKMNQDVASTLVPTGYDRKGFLRFVADRAVRLGVPSLAFMLVLNPLIGLIRRAGAGEGLDWAMFFAGYRDFVLSGRFLEASGPLWFAVALLVFSILYAAVRLAADVVRGPASKRPASPRVITGRAISIGAVCLITIIDLVAFLLRLVQPLGTSVMNMQLGYFSSYVVLFVAGLWAGRNGLPLWMAVQGFGGALSGKGHLCSTTARTGRQPPSLPGRPSSAWASASACSPSTANG
jgi:glucan biosynthesis protein C